MGIIEVLLIGVGLSMDAFAVSICKGLSMEKVRYGYAAWVAVFFGVFQGVMPILGWLLAGQFADIISDVDHWIAFFLLSGLGIKMIMEGKKGEGGVCSPARDVDFKELTLLAIATSIDAMAVGISMAFLKVIVYSPAAIIGIITFVISFIGVVLGHLFGIKLQQKSLIVGGLILLLIGIKILLEHMGVIS